VKLHGAAAAAPVHGANQLCVRGGIVAASRCCCLQGLACKMITGLALFKCHHIKINKPKIYHRQPVRVNVEGTEAIIFNGGRYEQVLKEPNAQNRKKISPAKVNKFKSANQML